MTDYLKIPLTLTQTTVAVVALLVLAAGFNWLDSQPVFWVWLGIFIVVGCFVRLVFALCRLP